MINPILSYGQQNAISSVSSANIAPTTERPFADFLSDHLAETGNIQFSNHAQSRIASRNIALSAVEQQGIRNAVDQAASKGAREALLLLDKAALVVNVPNRTVITAMGRNELASHVFTNIDSAVVVPAE